MGRGVRRRVRVRVQGMVRVGGMLGFSVRARVRVWVWVWVR